MVGTPAGSIFLSHTALACMVPSAAVAALMHACMATCVRLFHNCCLPARAEMNYPHGLFRKPLRCAVKRAVLNGASWRRGMYLVLDTGEMYRRQAACQLALCAASRTCLAACPDHCASAANRKWRGRRVHG